MNLDEYQRRAFASARIDWSDRAAQDIPLLGIIGELGSVASERKKIIRDGSAYTDGKDHLQEEFGDLLWYLAAVATRHGIALSSLAKASDLSGVANGPSAHVFALTRAVSHLVEDIRLYEAAPTASRRRHIAKSLGDSVAALATAIRKERLKLSEVMANNLRKGDSKFGDSPSNTPAPCFDRECPTFEQLPRTMQIQVIQRERGGDRVEVILRSRDMNIGDRLTDNASRDDGYRFHDVFHLSHAAVLGWSPVARSILRCKRKSKPKIDEEQDGARAAVIEEAIAHTVFGYAEGHSWLRNLKHIDHGILQLIQRMVRGLEVEKLAMRDWERAIFVGFEAFRALKQHGGGWLILDAETRSLTFSRMGPVVG